MKREHERRMRYSWQKRHEGALVLLFVVGFFVIVGGLLWLNTHGIEGVLEWLNLLGCGC